ncbi:MAG: SDR family NAD(P)-dependent oxidoreductase [Actinobacteria bacterium]|nr:SDR family NAD(P)-dependent oxidoreductase [Actinomycetota bacterium]
MTRWTAADIPDQTGRTYVITGANSGIGLEAAKALCASGAHVIFACRNVEKADAARAAIDGRHESMALDLSNLDSVRSFVGALGARPVDVLINNAGIMAVPHGLSAQGYELQFATNVLGHFLLTGLLLPQITDRVVTLSSLMHRAGRLALDDINAERRTYRSWPTYAQSKLADLSFAFELQRRLTAAGSPVRSMAAHPGYAATNLQNHARPMERMVMGIANRFPMVAQPAHLGALPTLYAATLPDLPGGSYVGPNGPGEMRGYPRLVGSSAAARDTSAGAQLWALCEALTGSSFPVAA